MNPKACLLLSMLLMASVSLAGAPELSSTLRREAQPPDQQPPAVTPAM